MKGLLSNIRFYVLTGSLALSIIIYFFIALTSQGTTEISKLVETYALVALAYLYVTLLAGPFCYTFPSFPFKKQYLKARRALGVAAFYFALLHAFTAFFGQLGGFNGLGFLDSKYLIAVSIAAVALFILFLLAITSIDYAVEKMKFKNWKLLHRSVYLAGILILVHFVMLGSHYSDLTGTATKITFVGLAFLFLLESLRFDKYIAKLFPAVQFGISFVATIILLSGIFFTFINPPNSSTNNKVTFDIHAGHKQLAAQVLQQSQQNTIGNINVNNIPGLNGDRTKRYTVSMETSPNPQPNQDTTIRFKVYDASSGNRVNYFRILFAKPMHFIIVNSDLTYFSHIHPTQVDQDFVITAQFPKDDLYHLYITFQPFGGIEQQVGFTLPIGQVPANLEYSKTSPDPTQTKNFGDFAVSVDTHGELSAASMSQGAQKISFMIKDAKTGKSVTNLKPYLASFGHLTMINQKTFDFIHVHPYNLTAPPADASGGPTVDFLPIGIYGPFKPGIYRAFAEFNPDNKLFTADFTMKVN